MSTSALFRTVVTSTLTVICLLNFSLAQATLDGVKKKGYLRCGVSQGLPGFSNPNDENECGINRKCPDDLCGPGYWVDYPGRGDDFCSGGECVAYGCIPEKVPREECTSDCRSQYVYNEDTNLLTIQYNCEPNTVIVEFDDVLNPQDYEIVESTLEIEDEKVDDTKLVVQLSPSEPDEVPDIPKEDAMEIKIPEEPRLVSVDDNILEKIITEDSIPFYMITFIIFLIAIALIGSGKLAYDYQRDQKKLKTFMEGQLNKGKSATAIIQTLVKNGWSKNMVEKAFDKTYKDFIKRGKS